MERDLVTGGNGLVGSFLICALLLEGRRVRAMRRSTSDLSWFNFVAQTILSNQYEVLMDRLEWVEANISDQIAVNEAVTDCAHVYHTAALVSFDRRDRDLLIQTNVHGTANVVNACLIQDSPPSLCHFSSTATIGRRSNGIATEADAYNPSLAGSDYAKSKYLAELEAYRGREEGLLVAIINPCIILGFGNWNVGPSKFFKNAYGNFRFYPKGSNAFVDVRDVVNCAIELMKQQVFDSRYLCVSENMSFKEVFSSIARALNKRAPTVKARGWMAGIAWRLAYVQSIFSGRALITKQSVSSGSETRMYSAERLTAAINHCFVSLDEGIQFHAKMYEAFLQSHK